MQMRSFGARLALVATMVLPLVSCQQFNELRATKVFMDANTQYERQAYEAAAEMYEEVIANNPNHESAYFYLANSYDNLFRPALRGEPDNDRLLDEAIDNYISSVDIQTDQAMRTLSMQYLVSAFGPDKADDPTKQGTVVELLIESDPANPDNYFRLAKLYEDSGLYAEAEQVYLQVADLRADDPTVYLQMAGFYDRNEEFEKTIEALRQRSAIEPDNPEAFYTIGTFYWEKAFRDFRLTDEEKEEYVMLGLTEEDKALALNPDYVEALTYKNILMRIQANLTEDLDLREQLIAEADVLRDRAQELLDRQTGA